LKELNRISYVDSKQIVRKVIALAHDYESLQGKLSQYDNETEAKVAEYKKEINVLTRKISTSTKEHREKEMSLKQRLHKLQEELAEEKSARQTSTNVLLAKEEELTGLSKKFGILQKKVRIKSVHPTLSLSIGDCAVPY
jgi:chromosome segregation ATPase